MDPSTITAIQTIGFPIVSTISLAGFSAFIIRWVLNKMDEKDVIANKRYDEYRLDMQESSNKFERISSDFVQSLDRITGVFEDQVSKKDEESKGTAMRLQESEKRAIEHFSKQETEHVEMVSALKEIRDTIKTFVDKIK